MYDIIFFMSGEKGESHPMSNRDVGDTEMGFVTGSSDVR